MRDNCVTCGRSRSEFPAIFKGDRTCSDQCRKAAEQETPAEPVVAPSECTP